MHLPSIKDIKSFRKKYNFMDIKYKLRIKVKRNNREDTIFIKYMFHSLKAYYFHINYKYIH